MEIIVLLLMWGITLAVCVPIAKKTNSKLWLAIAGSIFSLFINYYLFVNSSGLF